MVNDVGANANRGAETVADYDAALEYFFDACAEAGHERCALARDNMSGAQLLHQYMDFYNSIRTGNMTTYDDNDTVVTYESVMASMFNIANEGWAVWQDQAQKLATFYEKRAPKSKTTQKRGQPSFDPTTAEDNLGTPYALIEAVNCGDGIRLNAQNGDAFRVYMDEFKKYSKYGYETVIGLAYGCGPWHISAKEVYNGSFVNITTRTPILFVQGFYDPVTPSISAQNSSDSFVGSAIAFHNGTGVSQH